MKKNLPSSWKTTFLPYFNEAKDGLLETIWPCHCAICDKPGELLCTSCLQNVAYIDANLACPKCGAPYGKFLCSECNSFTLQKRNLAGLPLAELKSVFQFTGESKKIITTYKDKGEQNLAPLLASILSASIKPNWKQNPVLLTTIPMRKEALYTRGFDHMDLIAKHLSKNAQIPYYQMLIQPFRLDQRGLQAKDRLTNMMQSFSINPSFARKSNLWEVETFDVIIIDDVMTTGATLYAAARTLKDFGFNNIFGLTLARVV